MEFKKNLTIEEWTNGNELAISIFNNKYKNGDETFMETIDRISGGNEKIKQLILEKKFLPGGRICANRGLHKNGKKVSLSNCYVMPPVEDNLESIFDTAKMLARTFSYGGGCGVQISKLAFKGARVNNAAESSSGAVSFMDLYSHVTGLISQNGRRGALLISMDVSHPDIEDFIDIKQDLDRVTKANISIQITDEFMQAVKEDKDFDLRFTREETGEEKVKTVKARDLFRKIAQANYDMGEPGMLFWDRITGYNLLSNDETYKLAGTNPCVTGDTLILTDAGYYPIKMLVGSEVTIWNGYEWSNVIPQVTGLNQPVRYIETSDGSWLKCTDYHKFILADGSRVEAKDLKEGDKLVRFEYPIIPGWCAMDEKTAYTKGFLCGDGCVDERGRKFIYLYGEKMKLYPYMVYDKLYDYTESSNRYALRIPEDAEWMNDKFWIPNESFNIETRLNWLAGYIDSDGTLNDKGGSIAITCVNKEHLHRVKFMLSTLGISSTIGINKLGGVKLMPNHNDGYSEYTCQTSYRLVISAYNVTKLMALGLRTHRVPLIANPNRGASRFITITQNTPLGIEPEVYCFNEPKNHSGIFNGIITAQCGELPLPAGGACLLGSLNLSAFVKNPFTDFAYFDYTEFNNAVSICIDELNVLLDEGLEGHPLKIQKESAKKWRPVGLGVMGISDLLIKLGIRYGSPEAVEICDEIGFNMASSAIHKSILLAKETGSNFSKKKINKIMSSDFFEYNATDEDKKLIKEYGIKNGQLLTIAPTGSLSNVLGISGGIEPIFANSYTRKTESLHNEDTYYKVYTPIVKEYMDAFGIEDEKDLPDFFVTAQDIPYEERIKMQAVWQTHIDNSISSTVNLPESATVEDIEDLYMKAWENGLKGITVFRDNCKRIAVLTTSDKKEEDKTEEVVDTETSIIANKSDLTDAVESIGDLKDQLNKLKEDFAKITSEDSEYLEPVAEETESPARGEIIKVTDKNIHGLKRKLITGCGSLHCEAFFDINTGQLVETFLSKGSTGGCNNFMVGLSRFISMAARLGASIYDIVDQLKSTGSCPSYAVRRATHKDTSVGSCCPMAVGNALLDMYEEFNKLGKYKEKEETVTISKEMYDKLINGISIDSGNIVQIDVPESRLEVTPASITLLPYKPEHHVVSVMEYREEALCPQCKSVLDHEGGCNICRNCGYTKCD